MGNTLPPMPSGAAQAVQETVRATVQNPGEPAGIPGAVVTVVPTQVRRPWRSTVRTLFQALVALAVLFPILVETTGLDPEDAPWLAIPLAVAAALARVMALPQVEDFLRRFLPFLAAAPRS